LNLLRESSFSAPDIASAKKRLSDLISGDILPREMFYRFEGAFGESKLVIAFYLFADRRMCPVRIWNRTELFGQASAGAKWMVDFNGVPPWSAINGVEPHWHRSGSLPDNNTTVGKSARDWKRRACWTVDVPEVAVHPGLQEIAS
jgi:hypothetical protein